MLSINGDVPLETIAVDITEGFLSSACGEEDLSSRNISTH